MIALMDKISGSRQKQGGANGAHEIIRMAITMDIPFWDEGSVQGRRLVAKPSFCLDS